MVSLIAGNAHAQTTFEYTYGDDVDNGHATVECTSCTPAGFISVGRTRAVDIDGRDTTIHDDVYVVRTDNSGTRVWEYRYNMTGNPANDTGYSIRQIGRDTSFIITGSANVGSGPNAFLMKIGCSGSVHWARLYTVGAWSIGYDVVVAQQGGSAGTAPGDFVICGWTELGATLGGVNGFVMRTTGLGLKVWCSDINVGASATGPATSQEWLNALTECQLGGGEQNIGDIVAVGVATAPLGALGQQAMAVRMNGRNGRITGTNRGVVYYGDQYKEDFQGVRELSVGVEAGRLIFIGTTDSWYVTRANHFRIYLVKTAPDPCTVLQQRAIGHPDSNRGEWGWDVEDVVDAGGFYDGAMVDGDLVLTGAARDTSWSPVEEMILVPVHVDSLQVIPGMATMYGDNYKPTGEIFWNGDSAEWGETVHVLSDGFILGGWSKGNLEHDIGQWDPLDMYIVRTDVHGRTLCYELYEPDTVQIFWPDSCRAPSIYDSSKSAPLYPDAVEMTTANLVCEDSSGHGVRPDSCAYCKVIRGTSGGEAIDRHTRLVPVPNPVRRGGELYLKGGGLAGPRIDVEIFDEAGRSVRRQAIAIVPGASRIPLAIGGLHAGPYIVQVTDGDRRYIGRMNVTE